MKFCPFCGSKLLPNAKFCGSCGRTIPPTSEPRKEGCYICGKQELLPFTCRYCQRVFCASHRLPENHECIGLSHQKDVPWTMQGRKATSVRDTTPQHYTFQYKSGTTYPGHAKRSNGFIPPPGMDIVTLGSEIRDLALGTLLISIFVFSIFLSLVEYEISVTNLFLATIGALLASCTAFVCHELAHRYFAIRAGMQARFVLWKQGLYLTVFMIMLAIFTPFPAIAAPGFVLIQGFVDRETNGKISAAGPSVNVIFGSLFLLLSFPFSNSVVADIFLLVAALNGILALFNLLPFGNLDGRKIMDWNGAIWLLLVAFGLVVFIGANMLLSW